MEIISVNENNLEKEHICCAISEKKGENCAGTKKEWMKERFRDGLVFLKLDARGKVFIEYLPAEKAWCPVKAENYLFIDCFWVSGQYKGQGWANKLMDACLEDAEKQGKDGIAALSSQKKMPFLSDPGYFRHRGFQICDSVPPYFDLYYLPLKNSAEKPWFLDCCRRAEIPEQGMTLYYSHQCPHTVKYAPMLKKLAEEAGETVKLIRFENAEQAQASPSPFTTYSFFDRGRFVTNEIFSEAKFKKYLASRR